MFRLHAARGESIVNKPAHALTRREAIGRIAGAGALAFLARDTGPVALHAQVGGPPPVPPSPDPRFPNPPTWERELKELAPNVYGYFQGGGPGRNNVSISDAGVIVGDDGVMVIDTTTAPMHAKDFIAAIRKVTDKPFRHVINTHHHGDHVNGNQFFAGAEIVGHPYCRDEVVKMAEAGGPALWPKREGWADGTEPRKILPPVTTFDGKMTYYYGKNVVEVMPMLPAHTYGDLVVYLPQHKLLFAGDVAFFYVAPFCQNANPSNWIEICNRIEKMDVDRIVPGHGPLGGKAELAEMRGYLTLLKSEARRRYDAKVSAGAAAADIRLGKYDNWIGPERIIMDTQRFYLEFAGQLKPDVDTAGIARATEEYNAAKKTPPR
jgi:glyoxylase-like metal-dependent hydrolase (beta-lactamase superfamily II)